MTETNGSAREQFFAAADKLAQEETEIFESTALGMKFKLRPLTTGQKTELTVGVQGSTGMDYLLTFAPQLMVWSCCDPNTGEPMFTDDDIPVLNNQPEKATEPIVAAIARLTGLEGQGDDSQEAEENSVQEEAKKGS